MTPEQVKEKLEGAKWISKEIKGLYLELEALESGIIEKPTLSHSRGQTSRENKTDKQREQDREQSYKCSKTKRGYASED